MKTFLINIFLFSILNTGISKANTFVSASLGMEESDTVTVSFKVNGTTACKANIESVLTGKAGVLSVIWDSGTKQVTIKFIPAAIPLSDIHSFFALAGYDTSDIRAKNGAYDALSADCKYQRDPDTE